MEGKGKGRRQRAERNGCLYSDTQSINRSKKGHYCKQFGVQTKAAGTWETNTGFAGTGSNPHALPEARIKNRSWLSALPCF